MKVKLTRGEMFPVYTLSAKNKRWWVYTLRKAITPSPDTEKTLDVPWWFLEILSISGKSIWIYPKRDW